MKKLLLILAFLQVLFNTGEILAIPANPNPVTTVQPDGTSITYYIKGDEKVHWMQSTDGYTLLRNDRQFVVYANRDANGDLIPSEHVYRPETLRSASEKSFLSEIPKNLLFSEQQIQNKLAVWEKPQSLRSDSGEEINKVSVTGSKKALCVLVNFSDKNIGYTVADFEKMMNQESYSDNGAIGSVKDFYRENSYGKMDLTVGVVGPYTLPNTAAWYGGNENRWPGFAQAAIQAADADVDLSEYATNGKLETFHIIFAGYGDESIDNGKQIWSHKSQFTTISLPNSGIQASVYSCSPELSGGSGTKMTTIGVVCHELCHVFGSDDYYDTDYASSGGNYPATGRWDLMADGSWNGPSRDGSRPAHINMFQKILYGWVVPDTLQTPLSVTNMPNSVENPVAYVLNPATNNEQYVLENRQKIGFDAYVPGSGLLIYHIHNSAANGAINNKTHPQRAYVVCASATTKIPTATTTSYGTVNNANAAFASNVVRNEFSGNSTPQMFKWNGTSGIPVTDKPITEITQASGLISFNFNCLPVTNFSATIDDPYIHLSWNAPANLSESLVYQYNIYVNDVLAAENISTTTWDYQPATLDVYKFGIQAYSGECSAKIVEKEITIQKLQAITLTQLPDIQIYPNPVKEILSLKADTPVTLSITDVNGRTVYRNVETTSLSLPVQHWDKGIYLIRLQTVGETKIVKLIKQ
ncbi:MAG: M6 family metalloprotease domain-containing protein [Dysgonamonadaceae bacterium]|jgi:M6 family metalloprotease-like protein|nr:M6 family metalloprotease domain-containing protein [Dysgonamonadaceae bacterium]